MSESKDTVANDLRNQVVGLQLRCNEERRKRIAAELKLSLAWEEGREQGLSDASPEVGMNWQTLNPYLKETEIP